MAEVRLMLPAEYARHRGVSAWAVTKAIRAGRITPIEGKIDPVVADIQWAANTRARAGSKLVPPAQAEGAARASVPPAEDSYLVSRARREAAEAELAELRLAEQQGALIRAEAVRAALTGRVAAVRESILQLPARLAPVLAAELDQERCHALLEAELVRALEQLVAAPGEIGGGTPAGGAS